MGMLRIATEIQEHILTLLDIHRGADGAISSNG